VSKNVVAHTGEVVSLCTYRFTNPDGQVETCRGHAKCPICKQCSRIVDGKENGHCTGHLGLKDEYMAIVPSRGTV